MDCKICKTIAFLLVLLISSCTKSFLTITTYPKVHFDVYRTIEVLPVQTNLDVKEDIKIKIREKILEGLRANIGGFTIVKTARAEDYTTIELRTRIIYYNPGSRFLRFLAGPSVGEGSIRLEIKLVDKNTNMEIAEARCSGHVYSGFLGGSFEKAIDESVKSVIEFVKTARLKSMELPVGGIATILGETKLFDKHPPQISILSPQSGLEVLSERVIVKGTVIDDGKIKSVRINGLEVKRQRGIQVVPKAQFEVKDTFAFQKEIELVPGVNWIEIEAEDQAGHISKERVKVKRLAALPTPTPPPIPTPTRLELPRIWAFVLGISNFKDPKIPDLKFTERDAKAFYDFLRSPYGGDIPRDRITLLVGKRATRAEITKQMSLLLKRTFPEDLVIIYIATHGVPDPEGADELYFMTYDSDSANLLGTAIAQSDIERLLRTRVRAKKILILADACHTGYVGLSGLAARDIPSRTLRLLSRISEVKSGVSVLSAASANEVSLEGEKWGGGHGVFTYYLLRGLKGGADFNADGFVTLREIFDYVYKKVAEETKGSQHPELKGTLDDKIPVSILK